MANYYIESYFENSKEIVEYVLKNFLSQEYIEKNNIIEKFNKFIENRNYNLKSLNLFIQNYYIGYAWEIKDSLKTSFLKEKRFRKKVLEDVLLEIKRYNSLIIAGSLTNELLKEFKDIYLKNEDYELLLDHNYAFIIKNEDSNLRILVPYTLLDEKNIITFDIKKENFVMIYSTHYPIKDYSIMIDIKLNEPRN